MTAPLGLFDGPAPRLRAAPASAPFLESLADAIVRALGPPASSPADSGGKRTTAAGETPAVQENPFALSDALVLLPNRRARGS